MTVATATNRSDQTGNGVSDTFTFAFPIINESDLQVFVSGVLKTLGTHYNLVGEGDPEVFPDGGDCVFTVGNIPANGAKVVLLRAVPFTQLTQYPVGSKFPSRTHERTVDLLTMQTQQLDELRKRTVKLAATDVAAVDDYVLSGTTAATRAGKVIGFDPAGTGLAVQTNNSQDAVTAAAAAAADAAAADADRIAAETAADAAEASAASVNLAPIQSGDADKVLTVITSKTFTADAGTDTCTATAHGLSNGEGVRLATTGTLPGGLAISTTYFIIGATANTFQVSLTFGGAAVNITDAGTGTHSVTAGYVPRNPATNPFLSQRLWDTGDIKTTIVTTEPAGWLLCSGKTIGNAASGGTARANADTKDLFTLLWNNFTNTELPIQDSAGAASTRGASATADFDANKRMPLLDIRGRVIAGKDNMGGAAASRLTGAGSGIVGTTLGASGGAETHTLTEPQIRHQHPVSGTTGNASSVLVGGEGGASRTPDHNHPFTAQSGNPDTLSVSAHQNTQPSLVLNYLIKL